MPAPSIQFIPPYDIHLVRGQSVILRDIIKLDGQQSRQTLDDFLTANANLRLSFTANFKGGSLPAGFYTGLGITLFTDFIGGTILTDNPGPVDSINNFHITATIRDNNDGNTNSAVIRIHLHRFIKEVWLTPSVLTVQKGINGFKYSVHARFDDDVEAEISPIHNLNSHENELYGSPLVNYNYGTTLFNIAWSSPTANLINGTTGEITPGAAIPLGLHNVSALIFCTGINLAQGGGATVTANGQISVDDQLSGTRNDITASLVASGSCPGFARIDDVFNILFVPDGFKPEDRDVFNTIVDKYVSDLTTGKVSSPFDILKGSINFWKVFISSRERGATTKGEIYMFESGGSVKGRPGYAGRKPAGDFLEPDKWTFQEVLYMIGMPVRTDRTIPESGNNTIKTNWISKTNLGSSVINQIPNDAINSWKIIGERRLPGEIDTILGITINNYIAVLNDGNHNIIDFNPKKMSRDKLDVFLAALKDDAGNLLGNRFIKTGNTPGRNYDTIVFVTAGPFGRAQNSDGGFFTLIRSDVYTFTIGGTLNDFKRTLTVENSNIEDFPVSEKGTLTHELGHSFALEDEYGEPTPLESWNQKFINDPDSAIQSWPFTSYSGAASAADWSSNVQHRQDLLSPNPNLAGTGMLDANKIKWRFHRIKKCGVLAAVPVQNGNNFTLTLKNGHANEFVAGDKVFVRKRRTEFYFLRILRTFARVGITGSPTALDTLFGINLTLSNIDAATNTIQATEGSNTHSFTLNPGDTVFFQAADVLTVVKNNAGEPIATITRTGTATATTSQTITYAVSPELEVDSVNSGANQIVVRPVTAGNTLSGDLLRLEPGTRMIIYRPMDAPASVLSTTYKYAEVISKKVLDHLLANPYPFNAVEDSAHADALTEVIDREGVQNSSIPSALVPCCSSRKKEIVGLYSGGRRYHGNTYHPAGHCFMRNHVHGTSLDEFCAVCRYILVDIIDPTKHAALDEVYSKRKIYPE